MTTASDIETIRSAFGNLNTVDPDGPVYKSLCKLLDRADDDALRAAYAANIKFVSSLALNRMIRRGIPTQKEQTNANAR